jgi:hypothetical protein
MAAAVTIALPCGLIPCPRWVSRTGFDDVVGCGADECRHGDATAGQGPDQRETEPNLKLPAGSVGVNALAVRLVLSISILYPRSFMCSLCYAAEVRS